MMKIGIFFVFVSFINFVVYLCICVILLGVDVILGKCIVWIELIIIKVGFIFLICVVICCKFVFDIINRLLLFICKWFVWSLICFVDFLFDIYNILYEVFVNCEEICNNNVDFLILGFLLISIKDLFIILLFSIWLNFWNFVLICVLDFVFIFVRCFGFVIFVWIVFV